MTKDSDLRVAFDMWGPIRITVDKRARDLWGRPSRESLRKAFITLRGHGLRAGTATSSSPRAGKSDRGLAAHSAARMLRTSQSTW
jgi:hypothetical protein